nr:hypothetical protein [Verrucomicrobiota bacterium]
DPSRHGNSYFWRNVSFLPIPPPTPGNKTFGAIRNWKTAKIFVDFQKTFGRFAHLCRLAPIEGAWWRTAKIWMSDLLKL